MALIKTPFINLILIIILNTMILFSNTASAQNIPPDYDLKYHISQLLNSKQEPYLKIDLLINTKTFQKTTNNTANTNNKHLLLLLPDKFSSYAALYQNIKNISSLDSTITIKNSEQPDERDLFFKSDLPVIHISYELHPSAHLSLFEPYIEKDFFHFIIIIF